MQLQNLAGSLTRLELLPFNKGTWEMLSSMPHLRSLAIGCDGEVFDLPHTLSNLTKLQLALDCEVTLESDVALDLSPLSRLKVLSETSLV